MRFWQSVAFAEPEQLLEIAKGAEDAGFEGLLVSDHVFVPEKMAPRYPYAEDGVPDFSGATPFPEPWSAISAMASVTTRLRFSTMVYILPLRHPLEVAKAVSTAAVLSGNRVALGAGAGWMREEFDTLGIAFETRGKRFDEAIHVLRRVWSGQAVEHRGEFFEFERTRMSPAPSEPIPILVGGSSKAALRRAARLGDGWLGPGNTPEEAAALLQELRALREQAGRASETFETIVPLTVPPDPDALRRLAELGASGTVNYPFAYTIGANAPLEQKLDMLKRYGDEVIARTNAL